MKLEGWLRKAVIGGIFLLPIIPLIVSNSLFFPFISGKNFFFRILVEILFAGWILLALENPAYRLRRSGIAIAGGIFLFVITLADVFGENLFKSFWSNFERMEGLITLLHLGAYFVVAGSVLTTEKLWNRFWNTTLGVSIFVCFYAVLQLSGALEIHQGGERLDATLGNATYLAAYLLFHIFIALLLLVRNNGRSSWLTWYFAAAALFNTIILIYTATRGAVLGLVGGLVLTTLLIALFERIRPRLRKVAAGGILALLLIIGGFVLLKDQPFIKDHQALSRISSISLSEGSTRFAIWSTALQGIKERPVLGWGQENFNLIFNKYYEPHLYNQEPWFDHVHNIVLDWLVAGGILGALAYFSIPLITLFYIWRPASREVFSVAERGVLTGLLAAYFFQNLFVFDQVVSYFLYVSVLAYVYARTRELRAAGPRVALPLTLQRVGLVMVPVLLITVFYAANVPAYGTATALIKGLRTTEAVLAAGASSGGANSLTLSPLETEFIGAFKKAASYNVVGSQEVSEQLATAAIRTSQSEALTNMGRQQLFSLAKAEMEEQLAREPDDIRLLWFYGILLGRFGQLSQAQTYLEKAAEISPQKQLILFEQGNVYLSQGKVAEAAAVFKKAYELAPQYEEAKIYYGIASIYSGNKAEAARILFPPGAPAESYQGRALDDRIVGAYEQIGDTAAVVELFKLRVAAKPEDPGQRLSLARAYLKANMRSEAIAEIRTVMEMRPDFKSQGESYIQDIQAGKSID